MSTGPTMKQIQADPIRLELYTNLQDAITRANEASCDNIRLRKEVAELRAAARPEGVSIPRPLADKILEQHELAADALVDSHGDVHREIVAELRQCLPQSGST